MHPLPSDYTVWLAELKTRIQSTQLRVAREVNRELVLLYWQIGRDILDRQGREGWGAKVIDRLAVDLGAAFPSMKGFSSRNLKYMRAFAEAWPDEAIVQQLVAQLPWGHQQVLLNKVASASDRLAYAKSALELGWSRSTLTLQIERKVLARQGQATTNFAATLPNTQSELAVETFKDPYLFDFLNLGNEAHERAVADALVQHVSKFLMELGAGFAYVGRQVPLEVGGEDFYLDLLFYHLKLRCYVVIELKAVAFQPEHAGKLNFYLSAVDAQMKGEHDQPTIGLLLCKSKNKVVAEYALKDITKPLGVAEYQLLESLPANLQTSLPSIEEIELALADAPGSA